MTSGLSLRMQWQNDRELAYLESDTSQTSYINDSINLVSLRQSFHARLHTSGYYALVNVLMQLANGSGSSSGMYYLQVVTTLRYMRGVLVAGSALCP